MENFSELQLKDYLNYWLKLIPELNKDEEKLCSLYNSCTGESIDGILEKEFKPLSIEEISEVYSEEFMKVINTIKESKNANFIEAFMSIINKSYKRIIAELEGYEFFYDKDSIITDFVYRLYANIYQISFRICIKELHRSRLSGELKGNSKEEEFNYYTSNMLTNKNYLVHFYNRYPSLWSTLATRATYLTDFFIEVLKNIDLNKEKLISLYLDGNYENLKITKMDVGAGDSHQQGRSVVIINLINNYRIVYKPRSLMIDAKFQKFCNWLDSQEIPNYLRLKNPTIYTKEEYGFVSYVEYKTCSDDKELCNYYHRIGQLLALLYLFDAKDCHHENIIAHGDMPVLIDLETLFHGSLMEYTHDLEEKLLENSVLETLLLPKKIKINNKTDKVLDIGGIGAFSEQECPLSVPTIINQGRSDMKVIYTNPVIPAEANVPKISGEEISNINIHYINEIISGFTVLYDWINSNKLLVKETILNLFNNVECRLILHSTNHYATLLRLSNHPDLNADPINKEVFLCKVGINNINNKGKLLNSYEHRDLLNHDIPYFFNKFEMRNIYDSYHKKIDNVKLLRSPSENFKKRLAAICERDKKIQLDLIYWSFVHLLPVSQVTRDYSKFEATKYTNEEILNEAKDIAKIIMDNSIIINNNCTWLGMEFDGKTEEMSHVDTMSSDLYKGISGVALFFNSLYETTNLKEYELYTRAVCHQLINDLEGVTLTKLKDLANKSIRIGGFTGLGSTFYTLYKIALTLNDEHYRKVIINKILDINKTKVISEDTNKDLLSGLSGYIMVLLSIYEKEEDSLVKSKLKNIILSLKELLCDRNKIDDEGYTGFAHGTSGAIATLVRVNHNFPDDKNIDSIKKMLVHERKLFDDESQNWFTRENTTDTAFAWCNGACGILLSRTLLKKYNFTDELIDAEADIALNWLLTKGFGNNMSLCHGDIGNAIILMEYLSVINNDKLERFLSDLSYKIVDQIKSSRDSKLYRNIDLYGLMTGKSGEGYFLLKLVNKNLSNILFLE